MNRWMQRVCFIRLQPNAPHSKHYTSQTHTKLQSQSFTNTQRTTEKNTGQQQNQNQEEEVDEGPYIPKRKAKNPMMQVGLAWMIGMPAGIIGFFLTKRQVDKDRLKQLRIRQRMRKAIEEESRSSIHLNAATRTP
ncbi:hypothetical protein DNTS_025565 [Danionella cerebrum]|nr:hypothetical protein DNTS_025565 [Danionella translucida]